MKLIAGIGNPGNRYKLTRHNIGFLIIDYLAREYKFKVNKRACYSRYGTGKISSRNSGERLFFIKPYTYMNESGRAIACLMRKFKLNPSNIYIIHDDIDIPFGTLKIKMKGASAGHRGIESIIEHLESKNFYRIRVGIKPERKPFDLMNYVLSDLSREQRDGLPDIFQSVNELLRVLFEQGLSNAQTIFNKKKRI